MSMIRCDDCERLVDTDFDPEAIIEHGPLRYVSLCEWCRAKHDLPEWVSATGSEDSGNPAADDGASS